MAPRIRKVQITNNNGTVNFGNKNWFVPFTVSKAYNGSGGDNTGVIVNGRKVGFAAASGVQSAEFTDLQMQNDAFAQRL